MYKFVTFFLFLINSVFALDGSFDAGMEMLHAKDVMVLMVSELLILKFILYQ